MTKPKLSRKPTMRQLLLRCGILALLSLMLFGGGLLVAVIHSTASAPVLSAPVAGSPARVPRGQFIADARTLAHLFSYLLAPDPSPAGTNVLRG